MELAYEPLLSRLIDLALEEDLGACGDVTSNLLVPSDAWGRGELWAKEAMTLSGLEAFARVFARVDPRVTVERLRADGETVAERTLVASLAGPLRALLLGERTALNLVQRTSGMATLARRAAALVAGTRLKVLDTRKTAPGMRGLSKQAVRDGGAHNHRFGLFDGVLIKDNHIAAVGGSVREALRRAKAGIHGLLKVEVEVTTFEQLEDALAEGADVIMLDNMDDAQVAEAVARVNGRAKIEVSGRVSLERLPALARLGVDYVSMGALTHSARAVDLSLEIAAAQRT